MYSVGTLSARLQVGVAKLPADTTGTRQTDDVPTTKIRSLRVDDTLWKDAGEVVQIEGASVADIVRRALRAYVADPQAFNTACFEILKENR